MELARRPRHGPVGDPEGLEHHRIGKRSDALGDAPARHLGTIEQVTGDLAPPFAQLVVGAHLRRPLPQPLAVGRHQRLETRRHVVELRQSLHADLDVVDVRGDDARHLALGNPPRRDMTADAALHEHPGRHAVTHGVLADVAVVEIGHPFVVVAGREAPRIGPRHEARLVGEGDVRLEDERLVFDRLRRHRPMVDQEDGDREVVFEGAFGGEDAAGGDETEAAAVRNLLGSRPTIRIEDELDSLRPLDAPPQLAKPSR